MVVKITTLKNSQHILQHGHVVKLQKSLHASFYDMSSSSVIDVVKHIVISSFYNVVIVPTSLVFRRFIAIWRFVFPKSRNLALYSQILEKKSPLVFLLALDIGKFRWKIKHFG
jgi:hypothetical protein